MRKLLALLVFLVPYGAFATDVAPVRQSGSLQTGQAVYRMCDAYNTTGVCKSGSSNIVMDTYALGAPILRLTAYGTASASATYTCAIWGNLTGYTATAAAKQQLSSNFTETSQVITLDGLFRYMWVECTVNPTSVTVDFLVSLWPTGK